MSTATAMTDYRSLSLECVPALDASIGLLSSTAAFHGNLRGNLIEVMLNLGNQRAFPTKEDGSNIRNGYVRPAVRLKRSQGEPG